MRVVVIGGGLSGMAAAAELARLGNTVTLLEASAQLGGAARSFQKDGVAYPVAYHHILASDRPLRRYLQQLGLASRIRWSRPGVAIRANGRSYDLSRPLDLAQLPMGRAAKMETLRMGLMARLRPSRTDLVGQNAEAWLQGRASSGEVTALFEQIVRLRFGASLKDISAAYLHQRLAVGEGSRPLGYLPGEFWTEQLIRGLSARLTDLGVAVRLSSPVVAISKELGHVAGVTLDGGEDVQTDAAIAAVTPDVVQKLLPDYDADWLRGIQTVGVVSCVMETNPVLEPRHYWTTCLAPRRAFAAVFRWDALNPELSTGGRSLLNFSYYAPSSSLLNQYGDIQNASESFARGFVECFGISLRPRWSHTTVIPRYTPVYTQGFRTAPIRSRTVPNLFFAGNHRTFPAVATTGSALQSGEDAAKLCQETVGVAL